MFLKFYGYTNSQTLQIQQLRTFTTAPSDGNVVVISTDLPTIAWQSLM